MFGYVNVFRHLRPEVKRNGTNVPFDRLYKDIKFLHDL